jgi:hypothetical protein
VPSTGPEAGASPWPGISREKKQPPEKQFQIEIIYINQALEKKHRVSRNSLKNNLD